MRFAIIAPGAMGAATARRLHTNGATIALTLEGRGPASAARAAGMTILPGEAALATWADAVLAILPPGDALALAHRLALHHADQRRWLLPGTKETLIIQQKGGPTAKQVKSLREAIPSCLKWQEWEVPFDTDPDWPKQLQEALLAYRSAWRAKMDEVNAAISANAEQEELIDQPEVVRGVVRVSGPFTVESVRPMEESPEIEGFEETPIGGAPDELEAGFEGQIGRAHV